VIRTLLILAVLIVSCHLTSEAEAGWRSGWRARSVQQRMPVSSNYHTRYARPATPRHEFRGFGFGGYGYGSGFRTDFRPGVW